MQVRFSSEQENLLSQLATHNGIDAEDLVKSAALRLLEQDAQFRASVHRGLLQADRGELIDHDQVAARIEQLFQTK